ncbi:MAG: hypothetical protein PHO23_02580 [Candidatus Pacebacteria bacterium]|nr:hypothetical protein [Candidatus Paceibacterota bacterium]
MGRIIDKKDLQSKEKDLKEKYIISDDLISRLEKEERPDTIKDEDVCV